MCRKSLRQIETISSGSVAITVADRGSLSKQRHLPEEIADAEDQG
jgi:hypothetical protein